MSATQPSTVPLRAIKEALWADADHHVWAVLDGTRIPRLHEALLYAPHPSACLFAGDLSPKLRAAAPYLVQLRSSDMFTDRLLERGWGQSPGIFLRSRRGGVTSLRRHLKTLLRVRDESGRILMFRMYDPRVLRTYLLTCDGGELAQVFGGEIDTFLMESADGRAMLSFEVSAGKLRDDRKELL